ncbi:hypothetical protein MUP32_01005 [Candidatus Microgenomates bacterium]|nr:hypothetical protein [Candidatus Microgenomates bacterium]
MLNNQAETGSVVGSPSGGTSVTGLRRRATPLSEAELRRPDPISHFPPAKAEKGEEPPKVEIGVPVEDAPEEAQTSERKSRGARPARKSASSVKPPAPISPLTPEPQIKIVYRGRYADKMTWDQEVLGKLVKKGDLRSKIIIADCPEKQRQPGETVLLAFDPEKGVATVYIDDKEVQEKASRGESQANAADFVAQLNNDLEKGLETVMFIEKLHQLKEDLRLAATAIIYPAIPAASAWASYTAFDGLYYLLQNAASGFESFNPIIGTFIGLAGLGTGAFAGWSVAKIGSVLKELKKRASDNPPYFTSWKDLNPLKHLKDLIEGRKIIKSNEPIITVMQGLEESDL